ncbi:MAG: ABC transporter permease [Armatimonadota bacterium]
MKSIKSLQIRRLFGSQQAGLLFIIFALGTVLSIFANKVDPVTGKHINTFLNANTLLQTATDASFYAIMAIGATMIIISGGIDLSVGSIYALAGVTMAMILRNMPELSPGSAIWTGLLICLGVGLLCGLINGLLVVGLRVHPFIITLGSMWVFRGISFVTSKAESIRVPDSLNEAMNSSLGFESSLHPIPMMIMIVITIIGSIFLTRTVRGRQVFAVGGNIEASRYAGLPVGKIMVKVFTIAGLTAGIAAFAGSTLYGSASCADGSGYELYVIASAVVGGASLMGGKGNAVSAMLGAILITLIQQSIRTLHFDQNYESIIIGCAIVIAVVIDQASSRLAAKRLAQAASESRTEEPSEVTA